MPEARSGARWSAAPLVVCSLIIIGIIGNRCRCFAAALSSSCSDDASCSFNGVCKQSEGAGGGSCDCIPGWKGIACEQLDLQDAAGTGTRFTGATAGLNLLSAAGNWTSTWGGSVVKGKDGNFHMFAAMMVNHCGINAWLQNSVVLHATSPTATGAYTPKQIVAPVFSHEPIAVVAPTGEIVVFYTTTVQLHRCGNSFVVGSFSFSMRKQESL